MKNLRLGKIILSFGVILSLFAASLAACACSHHAPAQVENHAPSCHQTPTNSQSKAAETAEKNKFPTAEENCNCFAKVSQPFIVGKSENVKLQKTLAVSPVETKAENHKLIPADETAKIHFEYYFYNSNYLKKLTPPRAPPFL